ncbi:MAG: hypothetical protein WB784_08345, partial [Rhodanobacteraceae bacterium]
MNHSAGSLVANRTVRNNASVDREQQPPIRTGVRRIALLALTCAALVLSTFGGNVLAKGRPATKAATDAPTVSTINGNPLTIRVGSDLSFQVLNAQVPGFGQFYPTDNTDTADYGWFVAAGDTLYGPDFLAHPGTTAVTIDDTPFSPISISGVSGRGTSSDPFVVTVVGGIGNTGLQANLTIAYINGSNFFAKELSVTNNGSGNQNISVFLAGDLYLAGEDSGIPLREPTSNSPGGSDCGTPASYFILLIPLTPADRATATTYPQIWSQVGQLQLDNMVANVGCADNAAGLQWNRNVGAGSSTEIIAATSFGDIPEITQFSVAQVTPDNGTPGSSVAVTISGIGFESGTNFDFDSGISVNNLVIVNANTATATLAIAADAMPGSRTVIATQGSSGLMDSLPDGFRVLAATAPGTVMLHAIASSPGPYGIGDTVNYTLGITNGSDSALGGLTVTAALPSQLSIGSVQCDASVANGMLTWAIGGLDAGASASCTFTANLVDIIAGCQINCQLAVHVTAQYDGGQTSTVAAIGTLIPPQPESTTVSGAPTTEPSEKPGLSGDGSLVIFQSLEKDLASAPDTNPGGADIYLHDRRNGQTRLLSRDASGARLSGNLHDAQISLNGLGAVFVRDPTGAAAAKDAGMSSVCNSNPDGLFQFTCPTTGMNGAPLDGESESPSLSADGTLMAFCSAATNLVPDDTNGARDVFVRTVATGQVSRVSVTANGTQGDGDSCAPMISGDGRYVVFTTTAENLGGASTAQVVRKDLTTGQILPISQSAGGTPGDADAGPPSISSDGQRIAFASRASNLVPGAGGGRRNAYIFDGRSGGSQSSAKHLRKSGAANAGLGVITGQGGQQPNQDMGDPKIACGGGAVSVTSDASNLVGGDTNGVSDYFVYGLDSDTIVRPAPLATGAQPNGPSQNSTLDCEATVGGYDTNATGPGNPNTNPDVIGQSDPMRSDTAAITLDSSYSGNWYDPGQSGHGFLLEALPTPHFFYATWYVFQNGQPLFLQGVGNAQGNTMAVDMFSTTSTAFPVGSGGPITAPWGRVTFTFTSSDDGTASWQPTAAGFTAGSMNLRRLTRAALVEANRPGATNACLSGIWYDPNNSGYGFDLEFSDADNGQRILEAFWYTYQPDGSPLWLNGIGFASGNTIDMDLVQLVGSGANFPPAFVADGISLMPWGHVTLRYTGTSRLDVTYSSTLPGYGNGTLSNLKPLSVL